MALHCIIIPEVFQSTYLPETIWDLQSTAQNSQHGLKKGVKGVLVSQILPSPCFPLRKSALYVYGYMIREFELSSVQYEGPNFPSTKVALADHCAVHADKALITDRSSRVRSRSRLRVDYRINLRAAHRMASASTCRRPRRRRANKK